MTTKQRLESVFMSMSVKDTFALLDVLEDSKTVLGYKLFDNHKQCSDLYKEFGWGNGFKLIRPGVNLPTAPVSDSNRQSKMYMEAKNCLALAIKGANLSADQALALNSAFNQAWLTRNEKSLVTG